MNQEQFELEIIDLIRSKVEGPYWDMKKCWHENDASLLHDIICMANNLENRDSYIILGIDEGNDFELCSVEENPGRKNNNELTTFLRDKKFTGGIRPSVRVENLLLRGNQVDVIIVKNSIHTPFTLSEDFPKGSRDNRRVMQHRVYTRVGDTNTPKDYNADIDKVEYLWRKRFGIHLSAYEKMKLYLADADSWVYDDFRGIFYYKFDPIFTIHIADSYYNEEKELRDNRSEFYNKLFTDNKNFHWEEFEIRYNSVVVFNATCSYNDGGRLLIATPTSRAIALGDSNYFCYYYYANDGVIGMVNEIFMKHYISDAKFTFSSISNCIIRFEGEQEQLNFHTFLEMNRDKIINNEFIFPDRVIHCYDKLENHERQSYINAKKSKWLYENVFLYSF